LSLWVAALLAALYVAVLSGTIKYAIVIVTAAFAGVIALEIKLSKWLRI